MKNKNEKKELYSISDSLLFNQMISQIAVIYNCVFYIAVGKLHILILADQCQAFVWTFSKMKV